MILEIFLSLRMFRTLRDAFVPRRSRQKILLVYVLVLEWRLWKPALSSIADALTHTLTL